MNETRPLIMVYDTETSGLWDFKAAWNAEHQPNLVQLGIKVYTPKREVVFETGINVNTTEFPSWNGIAPEAQNVHGISEELLRAYGDTPEYAAETFLKWANRCNLFVAHNEQFDYKIMQCFLQRAGYSPDFYAGANKYCTMMTSTNICKVPSPNGRGYKWPKLNEAYPHFFNGKQFDNAHNALADVNPCAEIFWVHIDRGYFVLETSNG